MHEKEEFFKGPDGEDLSKPPPGLRRSRRLRRWALLAGVACALLALLLVAVKAAGAGPRVKAALRVLVKGPPAAPAAPDPVEVERLVEKVVEVPVETVVEKVVEVEVQPPMPSRFIPRRQIDIAEMWTEIPVMTTVHSHEGDIATVERERDESYRIEMHLHLTVPRPNDSVEQLAGINPHLPDMLNDFEALVEGAEVSPFYHHLYALKTERIQQSVTRLDRIETRHNFFDLETVLEARHPDSGRKVLLVQSEMDVVSDGSDGDRWPELDDYISMSTHYQPFTSYGWRKTTDRPNPLLARWEERLAKYEEEFAIVGLSVERNRYLRSQIERLGREVADLRARSFLIAEADPFIVIPLSFLGRRDENEFGPAIGDYAVVVYEDKLYPAIAGDAGPSWKFGEASLRIAREISERASPYHRPVSDLLVTYLIFPGTAERVRTQPDLEAWHRKCAELLEEIGGVAEGYELHEWEDLVAKRQAEREAETEAEAEPETEAEAEPETEAETEAEAEAEAESGTRAAEAEEADTGEAAGGDGADGS